MWDDVWLPRLQAFGARWEQVDREALDAEGMLAQLDASLTWLEACWEIHGRLDFSADRWAQWCQRSLGWPPDRARELVVGLPNKSLEGDAALRALSAMVRRSGALADAFAKPAGEVLATLPTGETTATFRAAFADYLDRFGCRSDNFHDVSLTTWRENPQPVVALIKMYLGQPEGGAIAEHDALIRRRDIAVEEARAELAVRAPDGLAEFDRELGFARRCTVLNEDHNYWLDQRTLYWRRLDLLAAGRLLEERAVISQRDDVFFLTLDEVRSGLRGEGAGQVRLVAERRVALEFQRTMTPPLELGIALAPGLASGVESLFGGIVGASGGLQLKGQPATVNATTRIKDGQLIRVDGTAGTVDLLDAE